MDPKRQPPIATPPVKVVGFHVEGASPSPKPYPTLADANVKDMSTSPSPVIIPPLFQVQRDGPASPIRAPSAPAGTTTTVDEEMTGLPPIRTTSFIPDESGNRTPVKSPASKGSKDVTPRALPISPLMSAPPTMMNQVDLGVAAGPPEASPPAQAIAASMIGSVTNTSTSAAPTGYSSVTLRTTPFEQPAPKLKAAVDESGTAISPPALRRPQQQQQQQQQDEPHHEKAGKRPEKQQRKPVEVPPKKELTKAERRAIQEAQRAAKAAAKAEKEGSSAAPQIRKEGSTSNLAKQASSAGSRAQAATVSGDGRQVVASSETMAKGKPRSGSSKDEIHATKSTALFSHLPPYRKLTMESLMERGLAAAVPLEAVKLGQQFVDGSIRGGNARCTAMLVTFLHVIQEFKAPSKKEVAKDLLATINSIISFLVSCRPLSVTMGNAIKYIKFELEKMKLDPLLSEQQVKQDICDKISSYMQEKIRAADNLIVENAIAKIQDGDVILTYAHSTLVAAVLLQAHKEGRRFSVVVADARPHLEGRNILRQLLTGGIPCEYIYLNALNFSLDRVTKVMLGAGAVLSNGTVLARVGSAAVAMMAAAERIPVLVCSETYKFHERVQLDSITQNELGDPEAVAHLPEWARDNVLKDWQDTAMLGLLNLKYDAMPADFVSVVVTEAGLIPPTSVAVILRESRQDVLV